jgi:hypothetical protein
LGELSASGYQIHLVFLKKIGNPIAVLREGKIVIVPPEEIPG